MTKFEKGRAHVFGKYERYNLYVLYNLDGTKYMVIKENKPFHIGDKIFVPIKEKNQKRRRNCSSM